MGPVRDRVCAVFAGGRQGSGYVVAPRVVLTAAHVLDGAEQARVALLGRPDEMVCRVLWLHADRHSDIALLIADVDLVADAAGFAPDRWGRVADLTPVADCQAIGFPRVQRDEDGRLESEQFVGTLKSGSGLVGGSLVIDGVHTPPAARADSRSPWAGMSGAVVFADGAIVGVVRSDPADWQHGRIVATPVTALWNLSRFAGLAEQFDLPLPVPLRADPVAEFERRYAEFIARKHNTLTIFGLDLRNRAAANWPLDAAYLSLETEAPGALGDFSQGARPADEALADRDRVLLRGVAGSGKTTLVQWLAVSAARQELPVGLRHLKGKIPFVLPLRTLARRGRLPSSPEDFLASVGNPLAGAQPPGWAARILDEGRGLLLVDGLDEVDEAERDRVRAWLGDLLLVHPGNLWLVTSRPSAVEDGWLASEGFTELTLSPMSRAGVASFVTRWHTAARKGCQDPEEAERLAGYRESLLTAIRSKSDLGRLATNPLMCGMICALHRDRRGYLPHGRKELYDAALAMLIADRDQRRDIGPTSGIDLPAEPQIQLLQRLAYWLIRNGRSELAYDHAERLIAEALPSVPAAAAQGDAAILLRHLLLRSGLLREPAPGAVDFVHRTFQDYLGARRAVEEWDIGLLVDKAGDSQWEDVIRMAVAHARPRERAEILRALLARSDGGVRVTLLAMACLEHATELDPAVREEVLEQAARYIPPRNAKEAIELAGVGPMVLDLLPGPEDCPDDGTAEATVITASYVESDTAIPFLSRFARHPKVSVRAQLAYDWDRFPRVEYFEDVVRRLDPDGLDYVAHDREQLDLLIAAGLDERLYLLENFTPEQLTGLLRPDRLTTLHLVENVPVTDLGFLRAFPRLSGLGLWYCGGIEDFTGLADLPLTSLTYTPLVSNRILRRMPQSATELRLEYAAGLDMPSDAYETPHVTTLRVGCSADEKLPRWIAECFPGLRHLALACRPGKEPLDLTPLAALMELRSVRIPAITLTGTEPLLAAGVEIHGG